MTYSTTWGLVPALQRVVAEFSSRCGVAVDFQHWVLPSSLSSDVALCVFRVVEKSRANIARHSQAPTARVQIDVAASGIRLMVEDSGRGFDPETLERKAGLGFVSMRERLRAVHGTVCVDSVAGRGTTIAAWLPAAWRT